MALLISGDERAGAKSGTGWRRVVNETLNMRVAGMELPDTGTPKYCHDRCERSVQMRLYTLSKGQFALIFSAFLLIFVTFLMIGLAGPSTTIKRFRRASELPDNTTNLVTGPLVLSSPIISSYCRQLLVISQFFASKPRQDAFHESYDAPFYVNTEITVQTSDNPNGDRLRIENANRTAVLHCHDSTCREIPIARLLYLDYRQYYFTVRFYDLQTFAQRFGIDDILFYFVSYNPAFSRLEICLRFFFVVTALIGTLRFYQSLRPYPMCHWSLEQMWVAGLLPLLLLYNNPLFPLVFLTNSQLPVMVDILFRATFYCSLLLFWLCLYHGIKQTNRRWLTFYMPKIVLVAVLWVTMLISAITHCIDIGNEGFFSYSLPNLQMSYIFYVVIGCIYWAYLMILGCRSCKELCRLPYFDIRLQFSTIFLVIVLCVATVLTIIRIGPMSTNSYAALTSRLNAYSSAAEFTTVAGLLNCYLLIMAFVYSPTPNVVAELHFNEPAAQATAVLTTNDSEDELYGPELAHKSYRPHFGDDESDAD